MDNFNKNNDFFIRKWGNYVSFFFFFLFSVGLIAQNVEHYSLNWNLLNDINLNQKMLWFDEAALVDKQGLSPFYKHTYKDKVVNSVQLKNTKFEIISKEEEQYINKNIITEKIEIEIDNVGIKKQPLGIISFYPLIKNDKGEFYKLISFELEVDFTGARTNNRAGNRVYADHSVFENGDWYKFGVINDGVYKLSYDQLVNSGIPIANIDPRKIRIFSNGGGALPYDNMEFRPDDILECAIEISGETDGRFDVQDYILFYGQDQIKWEENNGTFIRNKNIFSDTTHYFLNIGDVNGKRLESINSVSNPTVSVSSFDDYQYHELERINLIKSGDNWLGESFDINTSQDFGFNFSNIDLATLITVRSRFAAASMGAVSSYTVNVGGASETFSIASISGNYASVAAAVTQGVVSTSVASSNINVNITYNKGNSSSVGYLDYIEVTARRKLVTDLNQLIFRDKNSVGVGSIAEFNIQNANSNVIVWDVSDNQNVARVNGVLSGSNLSFIVASEELKEYVAFNTTQALVPVYNGRVKNQDLHGKANLFPEYIIVSNPLFMNEANSLASFHEEVDGLKGLVVSTAEVYNEFSSGTQDITAIRDFVKMFYDQAGNDPTKFPKYLLLFGDASYDYKNINIGNSNFVPAYESANSFDPIGSYVSDDYFGLLDDNASNSVNDIVEIGIGRFPVQTVKQAQEMVNKVKSYYNESTLNSWRSWITFVGDDEDNNLHMSQADDLSNRVKNFNPKLNIDKIFLDAYPQVAGAGGNRYPGVSEALDNRIQKGTLLINYIGHGGELGWSHERILENAQINGWDNLNNMPLFLTATCEFSRFDDPDRISAGENVLLNKNGGGIGLLTTTRLVYSSLNKSLMDAFYDYGFSKMNNGVKTLGDLVMITKQNGPKSVNTRNFSLLGDPAVRLAYPEFNVVSTNVPDTIKALSRVTIIGEVRNKSGIKMANFNGTVYPTVFDKVKNVSTLNNDGNGVFDFQLQKNILFKGKASVTNGVFEFSFVAPKDIDFKYGSGRISYYAENGTDDAMGLDLNVIVGGFNENAAEDKEGPEVRLFMNDDSFVFGGTTSQSPMLIAKLFDENGINTTGNGIGHDIIGILDENSMESLALNDFYESEINNYKKGEIQYQLSDLAEGNHKINIKAWDVYNNSGEGYTEFVVAKSSKLALEHVLNYPNPFTTNTSFYFEHNQPGNNLEIIIQVFTVSGKVVKTLNAYSLGDKIRIGPIEWDGKDDFGDNIGKGVYVYKVSVKNGSGEKIDKFEKLVLLK